MTEQLGALVLIVDDNEQNARLARDVLRAAGFRTIEAASGADAVARATGDRPDVILMDIRLPDMDGADVARRLKEDPRTAHIPVVAVTSLAPHDGGAWFLEVGFDGYLEKPIRVREFPDEVRRFAHQAGDGPAG
jgi:two-component system cell cycle response regulator DivK